MFPGLLRSWSHVELDNGSVVTEREEPSTCRLLHRLTKAECCVESHGYQQGQGQPERVGITLGPEPVAPKEAGQHPCHPDACFQQGHSDGAVAVGADICHRGKASSQKATEVTEKSTKDAAQNEVADMKLQLHHKDGHQGLEQQAKRGQHQQRAAAHTVTPGAQQGGREEPHQEAAHVRVEGPVGVMAGALFSALHHAQHTEAYCAYAIILMALYWCTEALPLAVTALFPIILYPMMGIMDASEVSIEYLRDTNILFFGGLLMAIAVEHWNLHKRIALQVLLIVGVRPALLMLGFMLVTAFLSMWISNTASSAMMVPIAHAVLEELYSVPRGKDIEEGSENPTFELQESGSQKEETTLDNGQVHPVPPAPSEPRAKQNQEQVRFTQGLSLCVCYAASIGGIATLTGTAPNLVLQGQMNTLFPKNPNVVNFVSWFSFAFPTMVILLVLAWLWLQILFLGFNFRKNFGIGSQEGEKERAAYRVIQLEHRLLGPMTFAEKAITVLFLTLVILWFTREPGFFLGWGNLAFSNEHGESMVSDGTVAIFIGIVLFIVPSKIPGLTQDPREPGRLKAPPAILDWKTVHEKLPWNVVFLLGGGYALAKGSEQSGLSQWLGNKLTPLQNVPPPAIAFILCLLVATFTECTSNVATNTLFLPILASMAQAICVHPLYVMIPCTLATSLAFMLPVATPPNAIVFSFGGLKVTDMSKVSGIPKAPASTPRLHTMRK
ncbi:solute carrier family 13 member 2 isoform X4 [Equus przewalskii]|uniref:Solute carrier family 13 member 2 isoform X4 n=1 Tax=Equus przewalskii TaxID=9798 RepID=A0ABM4JS41_EQUPR